MNKGNSETLRKNLREQIALEEHLFHVIKLQVSEINGDDYADARTLLESTEKVLEDNFTPLNLLLDSLEVDAVTNRGNSKTTDGVFDKEASQRLQEKIKVSRILRDTYSSLNLITISNTLLHTAALALDSKELADLSLAQLKNLAPLVVKIGELMPEVIARELRGDYPSIDESIGEKALKNIKLAWKRITE